MEGLPDRRTHAAFASAVIIGGANFIAVSFSNHELPPVFGAALRFALAALLFLLLGRVRRIPLARGRSMAGAATYGLLNFGVAYAFLYYALVELAAGTVSVIVAAAPLFTLVMAALLGQERISARGVTGGLMAMTGIAVLSLGSLGGDLDVQHLAAAILATMAIAASSIVAKSLPDVHPLNMNALGALAGTTLLAVASLALGEPWAVPREPQTLLSVGWLVIFGSVGLFQLFLYVIKRWTASATVYAVAGMPVVAVGLGAVLLDQPVTLEVVLGGSIVIAAVYIGAISGWRRTTPEDDTASLAS